MSERPRKTIMMLKHAFEFDCTGSDGLSVELTPPLRRAAFQVRRQNGMPRAVALSLVVHFSVVVALFFQLVPQQFMRMPACGYEQQPLEVFLMAEPAGGEGGGAKQSVQAAVSAPAALVQSMPAAEPAPVVAAVSKPRPAVQEKKKSALSRQPLTEPSSAQAQEGQKSDSDTGTSQTGAVKGATDGQPGAGTGGGRGHGAPYDTSFGQADAPRFLNYEQPKYPLAARQQGREGTVILRLTIDERGNLVQVEVVSSPSDGFAQSAVEAIKRSTFAPAQQGGKAVASRAVLPMRFSMRH